MRGLVTLGVAILALSSLGVASANEAPMAEAGLDQDAERNTTVYLHAGGSLDPDGDIERWEWSIETPADTITTPDCPNCTQTWFVPNQTGLYNVTMRVVDDDGASREDTMFVLVSGATLPAPSSPAPSSSAPAPSGSSPPPSSPSTAPALPSNPGGGGGGGVVTTSGGGGSPGPGGSTARIVETEDGELLLTGAMNQDEYRIAVENGHLTVSGEKFQEAQTGPGAAPLTAFRGELVEADLTLDDARNAINPDTCKTSRGVGCAASVDKATYNPNAGAIDLDELSNSNDDSSDDAASVDDDDDDDDEWYDPDVGQQGPGGDEDNYRPPSTGQDSVEDLGQNAQDTANTVVDNVETVVNSNPVTESITETVVDSPAGAAVDTIVSGALSAFGV